MLQFQSSCQIRRNVRLARHLLISIRSPHPINNLHPSLRNLIAVLAPALARGSSHDLSLLLIFSVDERCLLKKWQLLWLWEINCKLLFWREWLFLDFVQGWVTDSYLGQDYNTKFCLVSTTAHLLPADTIQTQAAMPRNRDFIRFLCISIADQPLTQGFSSQPGGPLCSLLHSRGLDRRGHF